MTHIIAFILSNAIVASSAFVLTYKYFKSVDFLDSLVIFFLAYLSQIILSEYMLGMAGLLGLGNLMVVNFLVLLLVRFFLRKRDFYFGIWNLKDTADKLLQDKTKLFLVCAVVAFAVVKLSMNLANPPFGWDDLNYHFTFPVEWIKNGDLVNPMTVFCDPSPTYYPINGSLFYLWLIYPLHNVLFADLGQLPFYVLAVLCVYNISRKLGVEKEYSFLAAGLFLIIPNFFKQLEIAYVDVMVGGLLLCAVNFMLSMNKDFNFKNTVIYSASLGLLLGVKTVALPYVLLLMVPIFILALKEPKKALKYIPLCLVVMALFGGFSYIRNFVETGNPLYPLNFKILGKALFKGVMNKSVYSAHFLPEDYRISKFLFHEGLGIQTLILVFPAIFLTLPLALMKKARSLDLNTAYVMLLPVLLYLSFRYLIPLPNVRYLYGFLGLGMALAFYCLSLFKIPSGAIKLIVALCVLGSMLEMAQHMELAASVIGTFVLFFLSLKFFKGIPAVMKPLNKYILMILALAILTAAFFLNRYYRKNEFKGYVAMEDYSGFWPEATRAWLWLDNNTGGSNIAYTGRPVPFPLYGTGFKNNVYYVSVNSIDPPKLHYYKDSFYSWGYDFISQQKSFESKNNYRYGANYDTWLANLKRRNTDYLFVYSLHQTEVLIFPFEDEWARKHPDVFEKVFENGIIRIYRIIK